MSDDNKEGDQFEVVTETEVEENGTACASPVLIPAWKPGQSGNPSGRPKGSSPTDYLKKAIGLYIHHPDPFSGKIVLRSAAEHIAAKLVAKGITGNLKAMAMIFDRLDGKQVGSLNQTQTNFNSATLINAALSQDRATELKSAFEQWQQKQIQGAESIVPIPNVAKAA